MSLEIRIRKVVQILVIFDLGECLSHWRQDERVGAREAFINQAASCKVEGGDTREYACH